jgi:hypothetical protein
MSRHTPRHERWNKRGPSEYTWNGTAVRYHKRAWWVWVSYRVPRAGEPGPEAGGGEAHREQLGPFKRPRNAMMAAEERVVRLQRQHGGRVVFDPAAANP